MKPSFTLCSQGGSYGSQGQSYGGHTQAWGNANPSYGGQWQGSPKDAGLYLTVNYVHQRVFRSYWNKISSGATRVEQVVLFSDGIPFKNSSAIGFQQILHTC